MVCARVCLFVPLNYFNTSIMLKHQVSILAVLLYCISETLFPLPIIVADMVPIYHYLSSTQNKIMGYIGIAVMVFFTA